MDTRSSCPGRARLLGSAAAVLLLVGCVTTQQLQEMEHAWQTQHNPQLTCHAPISDGNPPPPGSGWIGRDYRQLRASLGNEDMAIGWPSDNPVLVYDRTAMASGCFDSYVVNPCGVITTYHCR